MKNEIEQVAFLEMMSKSTSLYTSKKELIMYAKIPEKRTRNLLNI